jgi:PAS domain S-box-containing protein
MQAVNSQLMLCPGAQELAPHGTTAFEQTENGSRDSERRLREMIDALPAAIYTTDAEGRLTHFNAAAVEFSGRVPELGTDQWCVSWKLYYPDGTPMPHDECPMAVALKEGSESRGKEAIAERPDGKRIRFEAYPTLLRDSAGRVVGGMNMLVDISDREQREEARARLAAIIESSDDAIVSKDLNGIIRSWNDGAERLFGYTATEAIGRPITMLMPPDRFNEEPGILERIRRGERIHHYETVRRRKDGTLLDISLTVSPITDTHGRIVGASKIARDITQRKQMEEALRENEERFRSLVSVLTDVLWTTDAEGRFVTPQSAWSAYTGQSWEASCGFGWADAVHPEDRENILAMWRRACEVRSAYQSHARLWHAASQEYRYVEARATPLIHRDGSVREWVGACTDVTERRAAEETLKEADRRKNEFLAILAHELRNPLAPIRYAASVAKRAGGTAEQRQRANEVIERQAAHMARLVDDLLDVSRITRGAVELRKSRIELTSVIAAAIEAVRPTIDAKRHTLTVDLPKEPVRLVADPARMVQVFANLLTNAAKYTDPGGWIELRAVQDGEEVVVTVRDNGIGIAPETMPHIFTLFAQGGVTLERSEGGLGVGLALVEGLVTLHGGTIEARSEGRNQGSEFIVRLPQGGQQLEETDTRRNTAHPESRDRARVLVADDNPDSADSCAALLELWGHDVQVAYTGPQALALAESFRPQVLLLDIGMPGLNGYEVAERIRAHEWGQDMTLVAITGWGQADDKRRALAVGFDHHLTKPIDPESLEPLLRRLWHKPSAHSLSNLS